MRFPTKPLKFHYFQARMASIDAPWRQKTEHARSRPLNITIFNLVPWPFPIFQIQNGGPGTWLTRFTETARASTTPICSKTISPLVRKNLYSLYRGEPRSGGGGGGGYRRKFWRKPLKDTRNPVVLWLSLNFTHKITNYPIGYQFWTLRQTSIELKKRKQSLCASFYFVTCAF